MSDLAHQQAFNAAYDMGGRRRSASFDEDQYMKAFFDSMINQAQNIYQKKDLEQDLRKLRDEMLADSETNTKE